MDKESYNPSRAHPPGCSKIEDGSQEQQLVADYRERGLSYSETTILINRWCYSNRRDDITRSAVYTCEQRMVRSVTKVGRRPQGKRDPDSKWAKCPYRWVTQLLIRLGYHDADPTNVPKGAVKLDELQMRM